MPLNRLILCSLVYGDEIMRPLLCRFFYGVRTFRLSSATTRLATPILLSLYLYYPVYTVDWGTSCCWMMFVAKKKLDCIVCLALCVNNVRIGAVFGACQCRYKFQTGTASQVRCRYEIKNQKMSKIKTSKIIVQVGIIDWYQNIIVGKLPIYSIDQFLMLFQLVVVSWKQSLFV